MGIRGYDQWKTASPYDNQPDYVEMARKYIKQHPGGDSVQGPEIEEAITIIEGLLSILNDEGVI